MTDSDPSDPWPDKSEYPKIMRVEHPDNGETLGDVAYEINAVPIAELEALVQEWRSGRWYDKDGRDCADELQELIEDYNE